MKLRVDSWIITAAIIGLPYMIPCTEEFKPSSTPIKSHTGLYFDEIVHIFFYHTQWKVVSYVNLKPTQVLWRQVKARQSQIVNYGSKIHNATWYLLSDFHAFTPYIRSKIKYVEQLGDIVADYFSFHSEPKRVRRCILNLEGGILKFLFGTLTQSDTKKYMQHIQKLEDEQQSFLRILQEQMVVLKSAIATFNLTMQKIYRNEKI